MAGALALSLSLLGVGCVGTGEGVPYVDPESGEVPASYPEIESMVFTPMCALPGCHAGGAAPKGLSLEAGRARGMLVGVPSVELPELARVAPGDSAGSYLVVKLADFDRRRVGSRMPRTGPPYLSYEQVTAIEHWIDAGAAGDWVEGEEDTSPPETGDSGTGSRR